ncbi:MAG TPA: sulfite exporter TauE/SafE family protein [Alphaproteobacteria bacterium]|nr:sulfite exporter TauE/SafE family protein [Alphaproteobacteria bacterium]HOO51450.1 sulfite exporter TauE/SafE family protein [Alphaproteobacteria bacterium]
MLEILFFITALIYAVIGFGGGSTYNALLVLGNTDYQLIPIISLICNILVVSGGVWHFYRGGHIQIMRIAPWIIFSIPASFVGGIISVPEIIFTGVLGCSLLLSGIRLLWPEKEDQFFTSIKVLQHRFMTAILGALLGLLAGITGIGGGIFLAPILHFMRWGNAKQIAGACALFILVNSLAGLTGQSLKIEGANLFPVLFPYWVLLPAVIIGGQIGSWLGTTQIKKWIIKKMTGVLVIYVSVRLIIKFIGLL